MSPISHAIELSTDELEQVSGGSPTMPIESALTSVLESISDDATKDLRVALPGGKGQPQPRPRH